MFSTLARPQRCIKCGKLCRKVVAWGDRYVCTDACLDEVLMELGITDPKIAEKIRAEFNTDPNPRA